jgi:hypothetical protein
MTGTATEAQRTHRERDFEQEETEMGGFNVAAPMMKPHGQVHFLGASYCTMKCFWHSFRVMRAKAVP